MVAKLLEQAFTEAAKHSGPDQEAIAKIVLKQVSERRTTADAPLSPAHREMLESARREHAAGLTEELDPGRF